MHEKCAINSEGKRIYKDTKVNGKHEKLKHKLDQADSVTSTKLFDSWFFDKGNAVNLTYINFSKTVNIMPHQQTLTKLLLISNWLK